MAVTKPMFLIYLNKGMPSYLQINKICNLLCRLHSFICSLFFNLINLAIFKAFLRIKISIFFSYRDFYFFFKLYYSWEKNNIIISNQSIRYKYNKLFKNSKVLACACKSKLSSMQASKEIHHSKKLIILHYKQTV